MDNNFDTMMPLRNPAADGANDDTMAGWRDRKPDGKFAIGDLIMDRYEVLAELGQGGMGVVYKCFDKIAGGEVALKALPPELSHNTLEMEDIRDNFQLVHKLHHSCIAAYNTLERDPANGNYYLIMECCEGEDLRRWLKRKRREGELKLEDVLPIIKQVAEALDYAHSEKIIHRDIKPGNIMIDHRGKVKVLDFGLAAQIYTSMTRVSMAYRGTSGTGPYMAPEQWRGKKQGAASDQYALAVMAYEMLSGDLPFESPDPAVLREAVLNEEADSIPNISQSAQNALKRGMSKDAADRFESCAAFACALNNERQSAPTPAPVRTVETPRKESLLGTDDLMDYFQLVGTIRGEIGDDAELQQKLAGIEERFEANDQEYAYSQLKALELNVENKKKLHIHEKTLSTIKAFLSEEEIRRRYPGDVDECNLNLRVAESLFRTKRIPDAVKMLEGLEQKTKTIADKEEARRKAEEARLAEAEKYVANLNYNGVALDMVKIHAGTFMMGSPEDEVRRDNDEQQHRVTLTRDYWIGKYPVTQAQWKAVMKDNPSKFWFMGDNRPVENVSWEDAVAFCRELNRIHAEKLPAGYQFDLPTEAQWEYACRAGTTTALNNGKNLTDVLTCFQHMDEVGWYTVNSSASLLQAIFDVNKTQPVGLKKPNAWGLYDMHGNVEEWCRDWYAEYDENGTIDPTGPESGSNRVFRGGSWSGDQFRSASRSYGGPGERYDGLGFRLALVPVQE